MYSELNDEIVSVLTPTGDVVGRLKECTEDYVLLSDPRAFIQTNEGAGFAPSISPTCQTEPKSAKFPLCGLICVVKTQEDIAKGWMQQTSGIILK